MNSDALNELIDRVRSGDEEAMGELFAEFQYEIQIFVRYKLPRQLRTRYDSMDFVQSVYQSIMVDWRNKPPEDFATADRVKDYLKGTAHNKILEIFRRETKSQRFGVSREVSMVVRGSDSADGQEQVIEPAGSDPTPSQHVQAQDVLNKLTRGKPPIYRQIALLRREGMTYGEIAEAVGLSERSVKRKLDELDEMLRESEP
ncbi:MAG: RNA polymerase sigma factor [bacterium]